MHSGRTKESEDDVRQLEAAMGEARDIRATFEKEHKEHMSSLEERLEDNDNEDVEAANDEDQDEDEDEEEE